MNKFSLFLALLFSIVCSSQVINVSTSTYTVPQLVTDVLVNSPCVNIQNISSRTGTNFGSSNGIGYFTNTNSAFPMTNGVVLTTGDVLNSPGPNSSELSDGIPAWLGDNDLETALLAAGITMNSTNATVLEFDFTSFSPYFKFDFLFASEEYGTYQCNSPDAFAFLLTDTVTGITTNIGVIPSTSTPISVETIRNFLYNSACPSANASFFGSFNGGSSGPGSPTNYNGQTVLLNATSTLVPNRTYHIKLVIADRGDQRFDSAIFLGGSSFDFNQDVLGADLTIAANTALCNNNAINEPYTITSGLDPTMFDFIWKDVNGVPISGETGPNLIIDQPGTYLLTYFIQATNCEVATNDIVIEYYPIITAPDPVDLYKCDAGLANYTYNLSYNTTIVDPTNQFQISYHESLIDAENNTNTLPLSLNVPTGNLPKQIWIRIQNPTTGCFTLKLFNLRLTVPPVANNPGDLTECETAFGSNTAAFNIATQTPDVLLLQSSSVFTVTYHSSLADANADANPIDITNPIFSGNTTIFVRIETTSDSNCFNTVNFNLIVKPRPTLDIIPNKYVCVEFILPTLVNPGTYYSGPNQGLPILAPGTVITTDTTIYIYNETGGTPSCPSENNFLVEIVTMDDLTPNPGSSCDVYNLPALTIPGALYYQFPGGPTNPTNVILPVGHPIATIGTTTVYTYFSFTDPACPALNGQFDVEIIKTPTISSTFNDLFDCNPVNSLPVITTDVGTANYYTLDTGTGVYSALVFPISITTVIYAFAENNLCRSTIFSFTVYIGGLNLPNIDLCQPPYTLTAPPVGEYRTLPSGGGSIIVPGDIIVNTRVYHFVTGATCTNDDFFDITFNQPVLTTPTLAAQCEMYLLPNNPEGGRYFTLSGGPATTGNTELFANTDNITTTTTIFIYKESTTALSPVCFNEIPWTITINTRPIIDSRDTQIPCYSYNLTPLANGAYFDDPLGVNPITDFFIDASDLNANDDIVGRVKTIYIYAVNPNDASCYSQNSFDIIFDGIEAESIANQDVCNTYTLPTLPADNFYYDASHLSGGGTLIAAGTTFNSTNVISPIFIYTQTVNRFSCTDENSFTIIINDTPILDAGLPTFINSCDTLTLPSLIVGNYFNQSITNLVGRVQIPATTEYTATNLPPTSVFVYAVNPNNPDCYIERQIPLQLFNVTAVSPNPPVGCGSFTLSTLPALNPGENYYSSTGGSGLLNPNAPLLNSQTVFIYAVSSFGCSDETSFLVTITPVPVAFTNLIPTADRTVCDEDALNDGITSFSLTALNAFILDTQIAPQYTIAYYESLVDANAQANPVTSTILTTAFVRVNNTNALNCFDIEQISIIVNKIPEPKLNLEYFICEDYQTGTLLNPVVLDSQLSGSNYLFEWTLNGAPTGGNTPILTANAIGNYSIKVTDLTTTCDQIVSTVVKPYAPYIEIDYSDAFETPSYIVVNILGSGTGNYEYQIDSSPFQDSNVFYNVSAGQHEITVRDKDGKCSPAPLTAEIINYPKFFTPNADGIHEIWNIKGLEISNPNAPISIFDRYGKLIKQITASSIGWDGTFNGKPLPATDYWFTVDFAEKGTQKIFKAHFSLKR